MGNGTPFCIGLWIKSVCWGRGALGSLVTGRVKTLTAEGLAIYRYYKVESIIL